MIAVFPSGNGQRAQMKDTLCAVFSTERRGLKAISVSWCEKEHNAAEGVFQVPDALLDGAIVTLPNGHKYGVCHDCKTKIKAATL